MSAPREQADDPRVDWGPGEWLEETQRLEAEVERLREALREIASSCTSVLHAEQIARAALEASSEPRP